MAKGVRSSEFADCLKRRKILKFPAAKKLVSRELEVAAQDLKAALESLEGAKEKWATIQAYYSMFHTARALLYSKGYREKSHYCLIEAIEALFVAEGLIDPRFLEAFAVAKILRENADYDNDYSKESAASLVDKAKKFVAAAKKILAR